MDDLPGDGRGGGYFEVSLLPLNIRIEKYLLCKHNGGLNGSSGVGGIKHS